MLKTLSGYWRRPRESDPTPVADSVAATKPTGTIGCWIRIGLLFVVFFVAMNWLDHRCLRAIDETCWIYSMRGSFARAGFYFVSYAAAVAAIVVALFSACLRVRLAALVIVPTLLSIEFTGQLVYDRSPGCNEAFIILEETAFAGQAFRNFRSEILTGLSRAVVAAFVLFALPYMIRIRFGRKWLALVPVAVLMSYAGIWKTNGWVAIYPSPIKLPCIALFAYVNAVYTGPRAEVDMQPSTAASRPKYLIYLVDESVRGDFLGINGCPIDTTPKLNRYPHLVNFGIASSASNFSAGTNIILQSGTQLHELPDKDQVTLKRPNLFQFAKAAGYKTYYLDGQGTGRRRHNFMTKHDFNHIDVAYQAFDHNPSGAHFENDFLMLRLVLDVLKEDEPAFIYVNKYGAHTCYDDCYPPTKTIFHPASDDRAARELAADRLVNSYGNALRWSVDDFFAQLLPALNLENTIVVYTSDHGESLGEGGVRLSHATADNPPAVQANVPMVLFGSGAKRRFPDGVKHLKDNRSHFHLFPTLLTFMGYEEQEVTKRYGAPLWSRQAPARRFLSGDLFARTPSTINEFK